MWIVNILLVAMWDTHTSRVSPTTMDLVGGGRRTRRSRKSKAQQITKREAGIIIYKINIVVVGGEQI